MKFGIRDICDVVFKTKTTKKIGNTTFKAMEPVLYIDTATASTLEQATTTVYAQGGRGNARLIAWEGEKTMTFTVTDALLSPIGLAVLSGAGVFKGAKESQQVHVHKTLNATLSINATTKAATIDLTSQLGNKTLDRTAPVMVALANSDNSISGELFEGFAASVTTDSEGNITTKLTSTTDTLTCNEAAVTAKDYDGKPVFVDFYVLEKANTVNELQIKAEDFGGTYYVEAYTLFRDQNSGKDLPALITFPNVKVQSNFTFNMSSTGDPSKPNCLAA